MEQIIGLGLFVFLTWACRWKWQEGQPIKKEADFKQKQQQYEAEQAEQVQCVEIDVDGQDGPTMMFPAHLVDKVERIKVAGQWMDVVDIQYLQIEKPKQFKNG